MPGVLVLNDFGNCRANCTKVKAHLKKSLKSSIFGLRIEIYVYTWSNIAIINF